jgi:hypothetical protein
MRVCRAVVGREAELLPPGEPFTFIKDRCFVCMAEIQELVGCSCQPNSKNSNPILQHIPTRKLIWLIKPMECTTKVQHGLLALKNSTVDRLLRRCKSNFFLNLYLRFSGIYYCSLATFLATQLDDDS